MRNGVKRFVISPGSRSAPLAIAIAQHRAVDTSVHFDERAAAFFAVGWGKATGEPAALLCTSGTAAANYLPAVVEASYSATPLIVLTADRPPELHECGALQTIDQTRLFDGYVRCRVDLPTPDPEIPPEYLLSLVDDLVHHSKRNPPGPVHINCRFREPLIPKTVEQDYFAENACLRGWQETSQPYVRHLNAPSLPDSSQVEEIAAEIIKSTRGVMIAGPLAAHQDGRAVARLAERLRWPLFADVASNLRFGQENAFHPLVHYDLYLAPGAIASRLQPDFIFHFGGTPISKHLLRYTADAGCHYIQVSELPDRSDPHHRVRIKVNAPISEFAAALLSTVGETSSVLMHPFRVAEQLTTRLIAEMSGDSTAGVLESLVVREIFASQFSPRAVFLAASLPVREADWFSGSGDQQLIVGANRGVNGIDGTITSACGFAEGLEMPTTLVIGDLAFLHDLNSLALLKRLAVPVQIVVLNNRGGGIFHLLPVAGLTDLFEKYFAAEHEFDFHYAAELFGLKYYHPVTAKDFATIYRHCVKADRPSLIEVAIDRAATANFHRTFRERLNLELQPLLQA